MHAGCLALLVGASALAAPAAEHYYLAPDGNDQWSGRLAQPNAARTDGPFATPQRARDAVRQRRRAGLAAPVEILFAAGTYYLREPLTLTPEDSGTADSPVTWRAADGAEVTLSGGRPVTGWAKQTGGLWAAPVPAGVGDCRVLRVGERWTVRARFPNYDPAQPRTGGWLFAGYGGEPWERGAFGVGIANNHTVGDTATWRVKIPAAGEYHVWLRYAHKMTDYGVKDMAGHSSLAVDGGAPVPLTDLPDSGGWDKHRWSRCLKLTLAAGERVLRWRNDQGGGMNLDAWALCDDAAWDPAQAIGPPTWWGAVDIKAPATGKHLLIIQCEACETHQGKEMTVPQITPPGQLTHISYRPGEVPAVKDWTGAEAHIFIAWGWVNAIVPLTGVDADRRRLLFAGAGAAQDVRQGNRYFIENVREALDAPNEWFLDRRAGQVLYLPDRPDFPQTPVTAAVLDKLIVLQGEPARQRFVEHVHFAGLRLRDTSYNLTTDYYTPSDAAVVVSGARHGSIRDCDFRWLGGYAVQLTQQTQDFEVRHNTMVDLGQGGVHLVGGTKEQPHHCRILGNTIERIGLIYKHVAGVYVTHGSDNQIAHNRIADTPRYAISLKSQGEDRLSHRNVVEYNEMLRTNLETNDTGAFESLGYEHRDSGNIVRYNLIVDSVGLITSPAGVIQTPTFGWGVYLDDYSSGTTVFGNIIVRNYNGGVCVHGGQNNHIENNIMVEGHDHQVRLQPRDDFMKGNTFRHNIVVWSRPESQAIFSWRYKPDAFAACDENVYWLTTGDLTKLTHQLMPNGTWAKWCGAGFDQHSVVGDPLFVDAAHDDYRLRPESPALKLGFQPIPVEQIGPRGLR